MTLSTVKVTKVSPENSPLVGIALVAHSEIKSASPATVANEKESVEVPLRFYQGNLNMVRAELHKLVDDAIDAIME